ncbi:hypothetical protein LBMAG52_17950 [Planctomycetia bacterium]|nr:hypothetical protein LBMAG52_17950 [Planctomycetia bacterium]
MAAPRMKATDLFGVSVVDDSRSQVVCPESLRPTFMLHLQAQGIDCSLGKGVVSIEDATFEVDVIITEAGVSRVFSLLHNYWQS